MVVTPKVRQEARYYFNCPTLEGAEIEDQGGPGTMGAHWEKRVLEVGRFSRILETWRAVVTCV
ncbi:hypothetical protein COOONC_17463 [Cooperia oncophora]